MAKAKVVWRERALADIARLHDFLIDKDAQAAQRAAKVMFEGSLLLENAPRLGRPIPDGTKRRELFLPFGSGFYAVRYFVDAKNTVVIVRVWHSKENRTYLTDSG